MSTTAEIKIEKATSLKVTVKVVKKDPDRQERRIPVDISGWTIRFVVRNTDDPTDPVTPHIIKNTPTDITILTPAINGVFTFTIAKADTSSMTPGDFRYGIRRQDAGSETMELKGDFILEKAIETT